VARDRKRSKQRRNRGGAAGAGNQPNGAGDQPNPFDPTEKPIDALSRTDVPGALEHSSGADDEFDAAIVAGAGGVPVGPDAEIADENAIADGPDRLSESEIDTEAELEGDVTADQLQETAGPSGRVRATPEQASGAPVRSGNRAIGFLRASWAELHRVQWPDRRQVTQATAVVIGFVAIAGAYLGVADYVAKEIVEFIL
jgi:preprotein translocase subunit SecE